MKDLDLSSVELRVLATLKNANELKAQVMAQLPRIARPLTTGRSPGLLAVDQPARLFQQNSVHKLEALVPVRVANSKPLEGDWVGKELTATRVIGSVFGGKHYILQIGYETQVGYAASFRLVFVVHAPVPADKALTDPEMIADAERTATAMMLMLNMRRRDAPQAVTVAVNERASKNPDLLMQEMKELADGHIPGTPLVGKRADLLIVDEISDNETK